ncbi:MAG: hypothetical protein WCG98_02495 [bacterium]
MNTTPVPTTKPVQPNTQATAPRQSVPQAVRPTPIQTVKVAPVQASKTVVAQPA